MTKDVNLDQLQKDAVEIFNQLCLFRIYHLCNQEKF